SDPNCQSQPRETRSRTCSKRHPTVPPARRSNPKSICFACPARLAGRALCLIPSAARRPGPARHFAGKWMTAFLRAGLQYRRLRRAQSSLRGGRDGEDRSLPLALVRGHAAVAGASEPTARRNAMHGAQAQGPAPASLGATLLGGGGTRFRVWAPARRLVEVVLEGGAGAPAVFPLRPQPGGYHQGDVPGAQAGTTYRYRLDEDLLRPDPASRFQPEGPRGPSQVIDPDTFRWSDSGWRGLDAAEQVYYELHIGTFTAEGTWRAAEEQLPELSQLGVTALEVMPVAEFAGAFGWGYDGVDMFAPYHRYGTPDDFRSFVDRAHGHGLGVILDVVYNHLGPDGNYLPDFSDSYFTDAYEAEWGDPLNFHGPGSAPVREFFITNAAYWIREFHLDGLRLDATPRLHDVPSGPAHILAAVTRAARAAAKGRSIVVVAENEPQHAELVRPEEEGGMEMDGVWNDDFHHSAIVALTGRTEAYYHDYLGTPQELVSSARWGY